MRRLFRRVGYTLAIVVAALALLLGAAWAKSERALSRIHALPDVALPVTGSAAQVERGRHLAATRGCTDCHAADLGGAVTLDAPAIGRIASSNLTSAGVLRDYDDAALERAIRHGVRADGRALILMPSIDYAGLSDADTAALVAYLRSLPPVERTLPRSAMGPLWRVLYLFGQLPILHVERIAHDRAPVQAPIAAVTPEYGHYVAQVCIGCHGGDFAGGPVPGAPPGFPAAANLTFDASGLAGWSEDAFLRAMREGVRPDGSTIDPFMPWKAFARMDEVELRALYAYLRSLPPRPKARG